jgi:predicted acetyltransferase
MDIQLIEVLKKHRPALERLMQLYLYDFSEFEHFDVGPDGLYPNKYLDLYWTEPERHAFLICVDDQLAGFVLVNSYVCLEENQDAKSIAEFFVLRRYRRQGVGRIAAFRIFDLFPGKWEVRQISSNTLAQRFWRTIIGEYTKGHYREAVLKNDTWKGPVQSFTTGI